MMPTDIITGGTHFKLGLERCDGAICRHKWFCFIDWCETLACDSSWVVCRSVLDDDSARHTWCLSSPTSVQELVKRPQILRFPLGKEQKKQQRAKPSKALGYPVVCQEGVHVVPHVLMPEHVRRPIGMLLQISDVQSGCTLWWFNIAIQNWGVLKLGTPQLSQN